MIHIDWPYRSHTHGSFGLSWCITEVTHYLHMLEVAAQGILLPQTALALWHSWQCEWIAPSSCVLATVSWFNRIQHVYLRLFTYNSLKCLCRCQQKPSFTWLQVISYDYRLLYILHCLRVGLRSSLAMSNQHPCPCLPSPMMTNVSLQLCKDAKVYGHPV